MYRKGYSHVPSARHPYRNTSEKFEAWNFSARAKYSSIESLEGDLPVSFRLLKSCIRHWLHRVSKAMCHHDKNFFQHGKRESGEYVQCAEAHTAFRRRRGPAEQPPTPFRLSGPASYRPYKATCRYSGHHANKRGTAWSVEVRISIRQHRRLV